VTPNRNLSDIQQVFNFLANCLSINCEEGIHKWHTKNELNHVKSRKENKVPETLELLLNEH